MSTYPGRDTLPAELMDLQEVQRPRLLNALGDLVGGDAADVAERTALEVELAQLDARIRRLRERLDGPATTGAGSGAGLVLDFGQGAEHFRLGRYAGPGESVITPESPLGRALAGARAGDTVTYATPRGEASVTVIALAQPDIPGGEPEPETADSAA